MITQDQLKAIMPLSKNIDVFLEPLKKALEKYEINTPKRIACFLAQIAHESRTYPDYR